MAFFIPAAAVAAKATATSFGGAALAAAATEAGLAMIAYPAIILGGGLAGYAIGKEIYDYLPKESLPLPDFPQPSLRPPAPPSGGIQVAYRIRRRQDAAPFTNYINMQAPFGGVGYDYPPVPEGELTALNVFFFAANGTKIGVFSGAEMDLALGPEILSITPLDGQTALAPTPSQYPRKAPGDYAPQHTPTYQPGGLPDAVRFHPEVLLKPVVDPPNEGQKTEAPVVIALPEAGQLYAFNLDGVTITPYRPPENKVAPQLSLPAQAFNKVANELADKCKCPPPNNNKELLCRLRELREYVVLGDYEFTVRPGGAGRGGKTIDSVREIFSARIQTTVQVANPKKQGGQGGAPDVYYHGWFWWLAKNGTGDRIPLSTLDNEFIAPVGVTGFAWTIYSGYQGISSYTTIKRKDVPEVC